MGVVIHKQILANVLIQTFTPGGKVDRLLCVQMQGDDACLWYEVDPSAGPSFQSKISIAIVGTGQDTPPLPYSYVGTTQMHDGTYVWHWYAKVEHGRRVE